MNPTQTDSHLTTDRPTLTAKGDSSRCQHRYFNGKRCRLSGSESQLGFCSHHFRLSAAGASAGKPQVIRSTSPPNFFRSSPRSGSLPTSGNSWRAFSSLSPKAASPRAALPFSPTSPINSFTLTALPLREHVPRRRAPNRDRSLTVRRPALDNRCSATHDATKLLLPAE